MEDNTQVDPWIWLINLNDKGKKTNKTRAKFNFLGTSETMEVSLKMWAWRGSSYALTLLTKKQGKKLQGGRLVFYYDDF